MKVFKRDYWNWALFGLATALLVPACWLSFAGMYHAIVRPAGMEAPTLLAIWEFAFAFGLASIATLLASYTAFLQRPALRNLFLVGLASCTVLFLGYLSLMLVVAVVTSIIT